MKRWLMILLFAAGGVATEIAHPVQCTLLSASRVQAGKRRRPDRRRAASVGSSRPIYHASDKIARDI
ncbi:hypothetical protein WT01_14680 [Burkholderia cepacia]|uniref:hypothetical protein n=1 Tax=Burkholderia cepacia TaxID=292 RepID=UPI00075A0624|nr:hypothetical protein [Burkholderia cepacia]KVH32591.1 hypothetical protein WS88_24230 [Burkholderia cepacia]KVL59096.1 hypothetical protein WT01_14680 [Burkholderia cepacia]